MGNFMITLWNMSIQAGLVVLAVLLVRQIFRLLKIPKKYAYALWTIPFLRFICPWSLESVFSVLPEQSSNVISDRQVADAVFYIREAGAGTVPDDSSVTAGAAGMAGAGGELASDAAAIDWTAAIMTAAAVIWAAVLLLLVTYSIISYQKLRRRTACSICLKDNIYVADHLDTAFVMGFLAPRIYLPSGLSDPEQRFVIAHEKTHIRRRDYWVKAAVFFITCVHWFNPLAWAAFYLMGKDMEMSCDEAVLGQLGTDVRGEYATALLRLTGGDHSLSGVPLAFGEGNTRGRIVHIMRYRKPALAAAIVAVGALVLLAAALLTDPKSAVKLSEISELSAALPEEQEEAEGRVVFRTADGQITDFPAAYEDIFSEYLADMKVEREPKEDAFSAGRDEGPSIHFANGGYFYFNEEMSMVWCGIGDQGSETYQIQDPQALAQFVQQQIGSITSAEGPEDMAYDEVEVTPPALSLGMTLGSDGVQLDYADESLLIFHDWFGLFVYDLKVKQFVGAVDLSAIGCSDTQGKNACEVLASADGGTVYLHPAQDDGMYVYRVETNTMTKEKYDISGIEIFTDFSDTREAVADHASSFRSERCVEVEAEEGVCYGLLESDGSIEDIYYAGYESGGDQPLFRIKLFSNLSQAQTAGTVDSRMYSMSVKEGSVSAGGLELELYNFADGPMRYGDDYRLYRWYEEWEKYTGWDSEEPQYVNEGGGSTIELSIDWTGVCGKLPPGSYRIAKTVWVQGEDGVEEEIELTAEFEVE